MTSNDTTTRMGIAVLTACALSGSKCSPTSMDAIKALRACSASAIQASDSIAYFGPNNVPIGTLYQKEGSGFDPLWKGTQITGNPPAADMVSEPDYAKCASNTSAKVDLKLTFGASASASPLSGSVSNDFSHSAVSAVTADSIGWEVLFKGPYQAALLTNSTIKNDIASRDAYVTVAILKVKGYSVDYKVNTQDTASAQAKYAPPSGHVQIGQFNGGVDYSWSSDGTLTFTVTAETNIGGVMRAVNKGVVASASTTSTLFGAAVGKDADSVSITKPWLN
jgi:hypothetical protein